MKNEIIEYKEVKRFNILMVVTVWIGAFTMLLLLHQYLESQTYSISKGATISGGVFLSVYYLSKSSGIELNYEDHVYRQYNSSIFGKKGEWKCLDPYTDVVMLSKKGGKTFQTMIPDNRLDGVGFYELYLMDPNHRRKLFVFTSQNLKKVKGKIVVFQDKGFHYRKYSPVSISKPRRRSGN